MSCLNIETLMLLMVNFNVINQVHNFMLIFNGTKRFDESDDNSCSCGQ